VTFQAESLIVNADPTRLAQVVNNMLDNAVKFTPEGGAVDVDVRREGEQGIVQVTDTGIGIDPAMLPKIFELFTQAEQGRDRSLGGLGVGLTLSQRLVAMHGGTIAAASEGRGRGAQFTVRLPLEPVGKPSPTPAVVSTARSRSVLIIEDNADARQSLRLLLESLGHRVLEAGDGAAGLALARAAQPDVVLIDLGLPELDGLEVARSLRTGGSERMVLIAVTGYGQAEDRRRSREAGFDAHLVKPVSPAVLSTLIAAA
jgi:CheY-like chemotaxis protein